MQQSLYRMPVEITKVQNRKQLREFVNFPERLYKDNPYYVPPLVFDQMDTLDQEKGAAQEFCKSGLYLAYKDGECVGRVATRSSWREINELAPLISARAVVVHTGKAGSQHFAYARNL